jgi:hypothetical protein
MRDDIIYRAVVDQALDVPKDADHRDAVSTKSCVYPVSPIIYHARKMIYWLK